MAIAYNGDQDAYEEVVKENRDCHDEDDEERVGHYLVRQCCYKKLRIWAPSCLKDHIPHGIKRSGEETLHRCAILNVVKNIIKISPFINS